MIKENVRSTCSPLYKGGIQGGRLRRRQTSPNPLLSKEGAKTAQTFVATALEPSDRAILPLRYQEGLDYRAIAEVLECAEGTVASRLNRVRDRLRENLRKRYDLREESDPTVHPKSSRWIPATPLSIRECGDAKGLGFVCHVL